MESGKALVCYSRRPLEHEQGRKECVVFGPLAEGRWEE